MLSSDVYVNVYIDFLLTELSIYIALFSCPSIDIFSYLYIYNFLSIYRHLTIYLSIPFISIFYYMLKFYYLNLKVIISIFLSARMKTSIRTKHWTKNCTEILSKIIKTYENEQCISNNLYKTQLIPF